VLATFRTSMELEVAVWGEDAIVGEHWPTVDCFVTMVAMSDDRKPTSVPPLLLESDEDRIIHRAAEERRRARLAQR
jgi:acyl-CoA hydrolase